MKNSSLFKLLMVAVMFLAASCGEDEPAPDQTVAAKINTFSIVSPIEASGTIDESAKTISIEAPGNADLTSAVVDVQVPAGATVSPASGEEVDFSEPVEFTVTGSDASGNPVTQVYTVSIVRSAAVAFVGNAATIDELEDDARAAALWTQETYGDDFVYIPASSINANSLSTVKVIFYYTLKGEETAEPGTLVDLGAMANDAVATTISNFVRDGGQLLLAGDAAQYIFDIDRVPTEGYAFGEIASPGIEQQPADNIWGISVVEGTNSADRTSHPLFEGLLNVENRLELFNASEREVRLIWWNVGPEESGNNCCGEVPMITSFEEHLKATKLGSLYGINDYFGIAAVEFHRTDINRHENFDQDIPTDFTGSIIMLGNTVIGYEWEPNDGSENAFQENIETLTQNAIDYLLGVYEETNQ